MKVSGLHRPLWRISPNDFSAIHSFIYSFSVQGTMFYSLNEWMNEITLGFNVHIFIKEVELEYLWRGIMCGWGSFSHISSLNLTTKAADYRKKSYWTALTGTGARLPCAWSLQWEMYPQVMSSGFIVCPSTHHMANDRLLLIPCWPLLSDCAVTVIQTSGGVVRWIYPCFPSRQSADPIYQEHFLQGSGWSHLLLGIGMF